MISFKPPRGDVRLSHYHPLARKLIGAWIFNETGSKVIQNYGITIGQGNATMQTTPEWTGNKFGSALRFNVSNSDYALIPGYREFRPTSLPISIATRCAFLSGAVTNCIWTNDDSLNKLHGYSLLANDVGTPYMSIGDGGGTGSTHYRNFASDVTPTLGEFFSFVGNIYSTTSGKIYINGNEVSVTASGTGSSVGYGISANGSMGREDVSSSSAERYSNHITDYVFFWVDRSLTNQEALLLHNNPYEMFNYEKKTYIFLSYTGWKHKINSVANASISKVSGVSKANISKISGVQ